MNKKKLLVTLSLVFIFSMVAVFACYKGASASSWDVYIVRINHVKTMAQEGTDAGKALKIKPSESHISKGDVIVWLNRSKTPMKVMFREGKTCKVSTEARSGFEWDTHQECFVTNELTEGGTSGMRFITEGVYEYEIKVHGDEKIYKGKIVVE